MIVKISIWETSWFDKDFAPAIAKSEPVDNRSRVTRCAKEPTAPAEPRVPVTEAASARDHFGGELTYCFVSAAQSNQGRVVVGYLLSCLQHPLSSVGIGCETE